MSAEQEHKLRALVNTLDHAANVFSQRPRLYSHNDEEDEPTVENAIELLNVAVEIVSSGENPAQTSTLLFDISPNFLLTLFQFLRGEFKYAPGIIDRTQSDAALHGLVAHAIGALSRIVALAAVDGTTASPAAASLSRRLTAAFASNQVIDAVVALIETGPTESIRVASAELLQVFAVRLAGGRAAVHASGALAYLLECLGSRKGSPLVRNFVAFVVRELAPDYVHSLIDADAPPLLLRLLQEDPSGDVRALAGEALEAVFLGVPIYFLRDFPKELKPTLVDVILSRIEHDNSEAVVVAVCKLAETVACIEARMVDWAQVATHRALGVSTFYHSAVEKRLPHAMLSCLKRSPQTAAAACRALRYVVQLAPYWMGVGGSLLTHFPSLSALLSSVLPDAADGEGGEDVGKDGGDDEETVQLRMLRVELSIIIAFVCAADPRARFHVHSELRGFAVWMACLRAALLRHLAAADVTYYMDIEIVDIHGQTVNSLTDIPLDDSSRPDAAAIRGAFLRQEHSLAAGAAPPFTNHPPQPPPSDPRRREALAKVTFVVLSYAIHLALSPARAGQQAVEKAMRSPPRDGVGAGSPSRVPAVSSPFGASGGRPPRSPAADFRGVPDRVKGPWGSPEEARDGRRGGSSRGSVDGQPPVVGRDMYGQMPTPGGTRGDFGQTPPGRGGGGAYSQHAADDAEVLGQLATRGAASPPAQPALPTQRPLDDYTNDAPLPPPPRRSKAVAMFHLHRELARYYKPVEQTRPTYRPTGDGLVVRVQPVPWMPAAKKRSTWQKWTRKDLREGDLFYFDIPFESLSIEAVDHVIDRTKRHLKNAKLQFVTTPRTQRGRRWFLQDMLCYILPAIQDMLHDLRHLVDMHGRDNILFPILLFRDKEREQGEDSVHCGNVVEIIQQVAFYFDQNPQDLTSANNEAIRQIDQKIQALKQKSFLDDVTSSDDNEDGASDVEESARAVADPAARSMPP